MGTCPSAIGAIAGNITKNNKSRMIPFSNGHLAEAQILLGLKEEYKFRWIFPQGPGNGKKIRGRIQLEYHTCRRTTNLGSIGKSCLEGARGISGGEGGIVVAVVEGQVTVGERWYVSCFQRGFTIRGNRQCLCGS